jgi:hypothetical protein
MFTPPQLAFIGKCMDEARSVTGGFLEVGCESGNTTVFLNRWLDAIGVDRPYTAIDTFAGFTAEDIRAEHDRGTQAVRNVNLDAVFRRVTQELFDCRMRANAIKRVQSVRGDAVMLDYQPYAPICFALVDVDLYRPVKAALDRIDDLITPGGIIVVDDCDPAGLFPGAYSAYEEYCAAHAVPLEIELGKLGVIRKR